MPSLGRTELSLRSILYYLSISLVIALFVGYAIFQARFLIAGPIVTLLHPPQTVQTQRVITLEGNTQNITYLTLNGRQIYTNKDGYFKEALVLENGYTIATLQAHDRYGRSRSYVQEFVYTPQETQ